MNQKEVMEIKRRFTKDSCTFQRIRSVYVNSDKVKVTTADSPFLMLSEGEMFKYLDIAKKTLSGKAGACTTQSLMRSPTLFSASR